MGRLKSPHLGQFAWEIHLQDLVWVTRVPGPSAFSRARLEEVCTCRRRCLLSSSGVPAKLCYGWGTGVESNTCDRGVGDKRLCEWRGRKFS